MEIVDTNTQEQGMEQVSDRFDRLISRQGFEIVKSHRQGKQKKTMLNKRKSGTQPEKSHPMAVSTLESMEDGILATDFDGNIVLYNQKFAQMWGLTEKVLRKMDEDHLL